MGWLQTIREKPDGHKNKFALIVAILVTLIIVGVWFASFRTADVLGVQDKNDNPIENLKPFFLIFKDAKEDLPEIKN